ncbi:MAG: metallophosphoesterase [Magnetospirillum sp.]|nr:MAG: metallophosphoesterase [Magnetospirillum sp.]
MIKLAVLSDLHVEKGDYHPPALDCDLIILAGDVGWGLEGVRWIGRNLAGRPMIYVAGNREYWHHPEGSDPLAELRREAALVPGLTFLHNEAVIREMPGTRLRVLGATLWTDFSLDGDAEATMATAGGSMPDYRNGRSDQGDVLTPADVAAANRASVAFITAELARPHDGPTVVVTHHLPSELSLPRRRPGHVPQAASVSSLESLVETAGPELWIHGHSHADCDYRIGRCRILSRQRGTPENADFAPLLIEI